MLTKLANTNLLGWDVTGDIGGFTAYDSAHRKVVVFPRAPPLNPPTPAQEAVRDRLTRFAEWWRDCPRAYKDTCQEMACRAGLRITGNNFAFHTWCSGDLAGWHTVCRQANRFPEAPPYYGPP